MNIFSLISTHKKIIKDIGFKQYFKYAFTKKHSLRKLIISGNSIYVRKGTPDILVAISSLNDEFESLRYLLPKNYNGLIIDAGAYIGTASITLSTMFPKAKIVAIEPSTENLRILKKNLKNIKNVKIIHAALASESNKVITLKDRNTGTWGFTVVDNPSDRHNPEILEKINTININDICNIENCFDIGILKLDIEGGEYDLLENSKKDLHNSKIIFAELHERIIPSIKSKFLSFSEDRILIKNPNEEKYLSIKPNISNKK